MAMMAVREDDDIEDAENFDQHLEETQDLLTRARDNRKKRKSGSAGLTFLSYQLQKTKEQTERGFTFFTTDKQHFQ
jgi:hypothetical protein